jgi:hypothetical protein
VGKILLGRALGDLALVGFGGAGILRKIFWIRSERIGWRLESELTPDIVVGELAAPRSRRRKIQAQAREHDMMLALAWPASRVHAPTR